ncbi:hypothetical protein RINTHH_16360 [Richelia intracellularis HH01]|uniref:Uncharacterized protein n=1 Tax=Richelia intracellularis HH01 TaxID=1165094 RepID=M1X620_9NOST|nr:hypothetical protein RINTHH_16360 [Richelia intracellularis HH01]
MYLQAKVINPEINSLDVVAASSEFTTIIKYSKIVYPAII